MVMVRTRLIDLLSEPDILNEKTLDSLKDALDAYPFFQAGRMLWVRNLHNLDHIRYNNELKLAASFIPDRSKLFFLINGVFTPSGIPADHAVQNDSENSDLLNEKASHEDVIDRGLKSDDTDQNIENQKTGICLSDEQDISEADRDLVIGDNANYFEVDDSYTSTRGVLIDFSLTRNNNIDQEPETADISNHFSASNDMVLPSADLLDYERETYSSAYSLENESSPSPVNFHESHSFSDWLNLLRRQSVQMNDGVSIKGEETSPDEQKEPAKRSLIDSFLDNTESRKRIVPPSDSPANHEDFSAKSAEESDDLMTETLADIHIKQENYHKAVDIFERLRLKYPEKSAYFVRRIKEMEELINNQ